MKLAIFSDLHLDHYYPGSPNISVDYDTDLIVCAGDVSHYPKTTIEYLNNFNHDVIFVAGNHDFYGGDHLENLATFRRAFRNTNIFFLENDSVEIGDVSIFGATLWSEFLTPNQKHLLEQEWRVEQMRQHNMRNVGNALNDYRLITVNNKIITPSYVFEKYKESMSALTAFLNSKTQKKRLVVTHTAPTYKTSNPIYNESPINPGFHNDLDDFINDHHIDMWIYGHTHFDADIHLHGTNIVSNQVGYPREKAFSVIYKEI